MEDLSDIAAHRCIYETGSDIHGRPIIAFVARNFPAHSIDLNKVCSSCSLFNVSMVKIDASDGLRLHHVIFLERVMVALKRGPLKF